MSSRLLTFVAAIVFAMTSSAALACSSSGMKSVSGSKGSSTATTSTTLDDRDG